MGNYVGIFSRDPVLAGGANLLTWVLGIWAILQGGRWLLSVAREPVAGTVRTRAAVINAAFWGHFRLAETDVIYLIAFLARRFTSAAVSAFGMGASVVGMASASVYPVVPAGVRFLFAPSPAGPSMDQQLSKIMYVVFFLLVLAHFGAAAITSGVVAKRRRLATSRKKTSDKLPTGNET